MTRFRQNWSSNRIDLWNGSILVFLPADFRFEPGVTLDDMYGSYSDFSPNTNIPFFWKKKINISVFQSVKNKRFDSKMIYPSRNDEFDTNCIYCILDHFKGCTIFSTRKPIFASNLNKKIIFNNHCSTILDVFSFWSIL